MDGTEETEIMGASTVVSLLDELADAAARFDPERANVIAGELEDGIREGRLQPSADEQKRMFDELRSCRWFAAMQRVGAALVSANIATWLARRQQGQAQVELPAFDDALATLEALATDPTCPQHELAEARGLIGRVYKQLYIDRRGTLGPAKRWAVESSIKSYWEAYESNRQTYQWQGINAVAMLQRAQHDGLSVTVGRSAPDVAKEIIASLQAPQEHWDLATRAEAHIALGEWSEASSWMSKYVQHPALDSFAAVSTLRQLKEVWQVREDGDGGEMITLLQAASVLARSSTTGKVPVSAPLSLSLGELLAAEKAARERSSLLERTFGTQGPRPFTWYQLGLTRARSVARVETQDNKVFGTGFLMRADSLFPAPPDPGELLVVTNSHVLGRLHQKALHPDKAVVRFEALDLGRSFQVQDILFESPVDELDVTVVRLDAAVTGTEPIPLAPNTEPTLNEAKPRSLFAIGHPEGGELAISIEDNLQVGWKHPRVHYRTPTSPGSSGCPVFDELWQLVAVHHSGSNAMPRLDNPNLVYQAREGIWIHAIRQAIANAPPLELDSSPPAVKRSCAAVSS